MKFEFMANEAGYDSSKNEISESAEEQIKRLKAQKIGIDVRDIFNM